MKESTSAALPSGLRWSPSKFSLLPSTQAYFPVLKWRGTGLDSVNRLTGTSVERRKEMLALSLAALAVPWAARHRREARGFH